MTFCYRKNWLYRFLVAGFTISGIVAFSINQALAQRRPVADNTLGNENSRVVQDAEIIDGILSDRFSGFPFMLIGYLVPFAQSHQG